MFCSAITPSSGSTTLSRAVDSVLEQGFQREDGEVSSTMILASSAKCCLANTALYYYMASMKWNLQDRQFLTAASRAPRFLAGFALAGPRLFSSQFWRGVLRHHYPRMGLALQEAGADHLYANSRQAMDMASTKSKR